MSSAPTVHLLDALPYVFRAWFSVPSSLTAPDGRPVNAVHGFASFLLRYQQEEQPTHAAVCFDRSLTTSFRNELYPAYKSSRDLPDADLAAQLEDCEELAAALGLCVFADERYEADDLIATLAAKLGTVAAGFVVVSSDKDLAQLVDERNVLFDFAKGVRYGPDEVLEKFGVRPEQIADFLGLAGDAVDDIPGVPGVGAKTAVALLQNFAHLDQLYDGLEGVAQLSIRGAGKLGAKLDEHREVALLSRELATVARDAPVTASLDELVCRPPDRARVEALCERLGFERLRKRLLGE